MNRPIIQSRLKSFFLSSKPPPSCKYNSIFYSFQINLCSIKNCFIYVTPNNPNYWESYNLPNLLHICPLSHSHMLPQVTRCLYRQYTLETNPIIANRLISISCPTSKEHMWSCFKDSMTHYKVVISSLKNNVTLNEVVHYLQSIVDEPPPKHTNLGRHQFWSYKYEYILFW